MSITSGEILSLLQHTYPDWNGFTHPAFAMDEIEYKQATIARARQLLGQPEFERLLNEAQFDELITRLETVGRDNNLLWNNAPQKGDLSILYQPNLAKAAFCQAVFDLLYGPGESPARLGRYLTFVTTNNLPNKWSFPTYFLFVIQPDTDLFIKPTPIKSFLKQVGQGALYHSTPTVERYTAIREVAYQLRNALAEFKPRDMVDVQSVIWVIANQSDQPIVSAAKRTEFVELFAEFVAAYPDTPDGQTHLNFYQSGADVGRQNFVDLARQTENGEDVTDLVLLKLLPYANNQSNRDAGAWIHIAPAINGNIKKWFESKRWTKPEDWPRVATAILNFVRQVNANPAQLEDAVKTFDGLAYTTGFQMGMLTPILSVLNHAEFSLINKKPLAVINYLSGMRYSQKLTDYPAVNQLAGQLIAELSEEMQAPVLSQLSDRDRFDMFSHWLVAEKKFDFKQKGTKIADPPELYETKELAEPFNRIFLDVAEAEWAFEFLYQTLQLLGITDPNDPRFAITIVHNGSALRLNFPHWAVLQFYGAQHKSLRIGLALIKDSVVFAGKHSKWGSFSEGDPKISVYEFPIEDARAMDAQMREAYEKTFLEIGHRFGHWKASNLRKHNNQQITEAVFDPVKRIDILTTGLIIPDEVDQIDEPDAFAKDAYFTSRTLELLTNLHTTPTKEHYQTHKAEFKTHLEEPFQQLMRAVALKLSPAITAVMETEKKIFARILKNDYGQGGAWDFYWGAFYPQGGKRTEDAQLSMWIDHRFFECGFYIGAYGSESRKRFINNCKTHNHRLLTILEDILTQDNLYFSRQPNLIITETGDVVTKQLITWEAWLKNPELSDCDVSFVIPWSQLGQYNQEKLIQIIQRVHSSLFPLVLLATLDDPIPAILDYLGDGEKDDEAPELNEPYPLAQMTTETGLDEALLGQWIEAIERKQQAIVYGPPGTGKTYAAKRLARHLIAEGDGFMELVQFHPSYAYEDFVQGIRPQPQTDGSLSYRLVSGRFMDFCHEAHKRKDPCVLIIDEINRANLSRVFGELMYLLEYRAERIPLAGSKKPFGIPNNVRLIGTMNTADRSIALVDHALRRRFAFLALHPSFDILQHFHQTKQTGFPIDKLIVELKRLNQRINDHNYSVGISFFLKKNLSASIGAIWRMEIEPYLEEYFFDRPEAVTEFRWGNLKDKLGL